MGSCPSDQILEGVVVDLTEEVKALGGGSDPLAWCLAPSEEAVIDVVRDLVEGVVSSAVDAELPYRQHRVAVWWGRSDRSMVKSSR